MSEIPPLLFEQQGSVVKLTLGLFAAPRGQTPTLLSELSSTLHMAVAKFVDGEARVDEVIDPLAGKSLTLFKAASIRSSRASGILFVGQSPQHIN
jgi:hypothetical protein